MLRKPKKGIVRARIMPRAPKLGIVRAKAQLGSGQPDWVFRQPDQTSQIKPHIWPRQNPRSEHKKQTKIWLAALVEP